MNLDDLGLTQEEVADRLIERMAEKLLTTKVGYWDDDADEEMIEKGPSNIKKRLDELIKERIDGAIRKVLDDSVLTNAEDIISKLTYEETNRYGEPKAAPLTFREYAVKLAQEYLSEPVNFEGKSRKENSFGSWNQSSTRIVHLIHKHLHYTIEQALKQAVGELKTTLATGLKETVQIKLKEVIDAIQVQVKTK